MKGHDDSIIIDPHRLESTKAYEIRPTYVPYLPVPRPTKVPGIVSIIESKDRVHLRHDEQPLSFRDEIDAAVDSSYPKVSSSFAAPNGELDLGMEPLQKIVYKMQRLQSEAGRTIVDRYAAKKAGMLNYCSFLVGTQPPPKQCHPTKSKPTTTRPFK